MKEQVIIHDNQCIGCGLCVKDCPNKVIEMKNGKASVLSDDCIKCGHCLAICPKNAVEITGLDKGEIKSYDQMNNAIEPDNLMDLYKSMRSVRQFKNKELPDQVIEDIIEAGRYTATGTNRQGVRYIVIKDHINELEDMVLPKLKRIQKILGPVGKVFKLKYNLNKYKFERDFLFRGARALVLVISENELDAGLAAKSMEIMSRTHGLGGLHVGIFTAIANKSGRLKKELDVNSKEKIVACLALGYPDVKYHRTIPRHKALVDWR